MVGTTAVSHGAIVVVAPAGAQAAGRPLRPLAPVAVSRASGKPSAASVAQRVMLRPTPTSSVLHSRRQRRASGVSSGARGPVCSAAAEAGATRRIAFVMESKVQRGVNVTLVGNCPALGNWDTAQGIVMEQYTGSTFYASVDLPTDVDVEYKFIVNKEGGKATDTWRWLEDDNYVIPAGEVEPHVLDLEVKSPIQFGERLRICGSSWQLGNWELEGAPELQWHEGHIWRAKVPYVPNELLEYKFCIVRDNLSFYWQTGANHIMAAADADFSRSHIVHAEWCPPVHKAEETFKEVETQVAWTTEGNEHGGGDRLAVVMVKAELDWNESLYMSGGCHNLGDWSVDRAVPLEWTVGDVWMSEVWLPNDDRLETKLFLKNDIDGEVTWSPFENMHLYHDITVTEAIGANKDVFLAAVIGQQVAMLQKMSPEMATGASMDEASMDEMEDEPELVSANLSAAVAAATDYLDAVKKNPDAFEEAMAAGMIDGDAVAGSIDDGAEEGTGGAASNGKRPDNKGPGFEIPKIDNPVKDVSLADAQRLAAVGGVAATVGGIEVGGMDLLVASEPAMAMGAALIAGTFMVNNLLYAKDRERLFAAAKDRKSFASYVAGGGLWSRAGTMDAPDSPPNEAPEPVKLSSATTPAEERIEFAELAEPAPAPAPPAPVDAPMTASTSLPDVVETLPEVVETLPEVVEMESTPEHNSQNGNGATPPPPVPEPEPEPQPVAVAEVEEVLKVTPLMEAREEPPKRETVKVKAEAPKTNGTVQTKTIPSSLVAAVKKTKKVPMSLTEMLKAEQDSS